MGQPRGLKARYSEMQSRYCYFIQIPKTPQINAGFCGCRRLCLTANLRTGFSDLPEGKGLKN